MKHFPLLFSIEPLKFAKITVEPMKFKMVLLMSSEHTIVLACSKNNSIHILQCYAVFLRKFMILCGISMNILDVVIFSDLVSVLKHVLSDVNFSPNNFSQNNSLSGAFHPDFLF
jgi:hypothetical protein